MRSFRSFLAPYILIILACAIIANVQAQSMNKVVISDYSFQPDVITIPSGTIVTWTNEGTMAHTVTSDNVRFHSGYIAPGRRFSHLFDTPGDYPYHCNIHPYTCISVIRNRQCPTTSFKPMLRMTQAIFYGYRELIA